MRPEAEIRQAVQTLADLILHQAAERGMDDQIPQELAMAYGALLWVVDPSDEHAKDFAVMLKLGAELLATS